MYISRSVYGPHLSLGGAQLYLTPHKVRTKERQMSWIGCGFAPMHMCFKELQGLCKARTQVKSILYLNILDIYGVIGPLFK